MDFKEHGRMLNRHVDNRLKRKKPYEKRRRRLILEMERAQQNKKIRHFTKSVERAETERQEGLRL